jgi:hypothetical protein
MIIAFVFPHCGRLAADDTQFMLDDGCTLRCSDCLRYAVIRLAPLALDAVESGAGVQDLLELAEELIGYPSAYFQEKWQFRERLDDLRARLTQLAPDRAISERVDEEGDTRAAGEASR